MAYFDGKQTMLIGMATKQRGDLRELDDTKTSYVFGKKTSNLENDGDGTSPFAKQSEITEISQKADAALALAKEKSDAKGFTNYYDLLTELNTASADKYRIGQSLYVQEKGVPDLWIKDIRNTYTEFPVNINAQYEAVKLLERDGCFHAGYYTISTLETLQIDLTNYAQYAILTQAEYDAIETKDNNIFYFIKEETV